MKLIVTVRTATIEESFTALFFSIVIPLTFTLATNTDVFVLQADVYMKIKGLKVYIALAAARPAKNSPRKQVKKEYAGHILPMCILVLMFCFGN